MKRSPLLSLLGQLAILLPTIYFAWYASGHYTFTLLADLLDPLLRWLWSDTVVSVQATGKNIVILTQLAVQQPQSLAVAGPSPDWVHRGYQFNPFSYGYGIPLFLALAIASNASAKQHLLRASLGTLILLGGLCLSITTSLVFALHSETGIIGPHFSADPQTNDLIVRYVHFIGFLLVPRVFPLLMWLVLYRETVMEIIGPLKNRLFQDVPSN